VVLVNLNKFLGVVDLLFEENEIRHLSDEVVANAHLRQFGYFVELRIVHAEINYLLVVYNCN
jgi:hypothetical protein